MSTTPLPQSFFVGSAPELAQALLGCRLVHDTPSGTTSGIVVETEAYSQEDAASHSYKGKTPRTSVMFGPGGYAYIYFTYGMHYCFNVVSGEDGEGQAVLVRALEPLDGINLMKARRNMSDIHELTNGPAKLVQAMGITKEDYGTSLFKGKLHLTKWLNDDFDIIAGPRVGISRAVDVPWRFSIAGNEYVSRPRPHQ